MVTSDIHWQPTATVETLKARAELLTSIRQFMTDRSIMEVQTPTLGSHAGTDPQIEPIKTVAPSTQTGSKPWYLQTSPEYFMKRLLAAGSGPIYQMGPVFRHEEAGRYHNPEFTLLEWYRPGFDHFKLMTETNELLKQVLGCPDAKIMTYQEVFKSYLDLDIHQLTETDLKEFALSVLDLSQEVKQMQGCDNWLQLLLTHCIEPEFIAGQPYIIYDYPASQAALAKVRPEAYPVAERFEVYVGQLELANGYHELLDAKEQQQRFEKDNKKRQQLGLSTIAIDKKLIAALEAGLPACAGIALGVDRLMMLKGNYETLSDTLAFPVKAGEI